MKISLIINGRGRRLDVPPWRTLLDAIREDLKLKGTKDYCHMGVCGACTVLVDGEPASSCIMLAAQVQGREITTVEGLSRGNSLHPIQQAFIDHMGFQCGYCTPGMLLMTKALLEENPQPSEDDIKEYVGSNICRCTGYRRIIESVQAAAAARATFEVQGSKLRDRTAG